MMITRRRLSSIGIMLILLIVEIIVVNTVLSNTNTESIDSRIRLISVFCFISFAISIVTWKRIANELICPYLFFYICLLLFCCGQSLGWAFGLTMGTRDLMNRVDYGLNHDYILRSLAYSMLCLTAFHTGALVFTKGDTPKTPKYESYEVTATFEELGRILLIITIPAFIAETLQLIFAVLGGGYLASYEAIYSRSSFMKILSYIADYFQPCLLLLLVAYRGEKSQKRTLILALFIFDIISQFYIGGRNRAVLSVVGIILTYHYFVKPISKKNIIIVAIAGYFGIALLNAIALSRTETSRGLFSVLQSIDLAPGAVFGGIIGELGWSMSSTSWTMMYAEGGYGLQHGMTYLMAPLGVIPNLGFWAVHPAKAFDPGEWLQTITLASYGLGYTMVAESYINFGWLGSLFMFFVGGIIVRFLDGVRRKYVESNILASTFQIMFIMTLTKLLVRSTFASTVREIGYVLLPLYIIITYRLSRRVALRRRNEPITYNESAR